MIKVIRCYLVIIQQRKGNFLFFALSVMQFHRSFQVHSVHAVDSGALQSAVVPD